MHFRSITGTQDCFENFHVAGAAAKISGERGANFRFCRVIILLEKIDGGEDHAGGANSALSAAVGDEWLLAGIQLGLSGHAFDRSDLSAFDLCDGDEAAIH